MEEEEQLDTLRMGQSWGPGTAECRGWKNAFWTEGTTAAAGAGCGWEVGREVGSCWFRDAEHQLCEMKRVLWGDGGDSSSRITYNCHWTARLQSVKTLTITLHVSYNLKRTKEKTGWEHMPLLPNACVPTPPSGDVAVSIRLVSSHKTLTAVPSIH